MDRKDFQSLTFLHPFSSIIFIYFLNKGKPNSSYNSHKKNAQKDGTWVSANQPKF